MVALEQIDKTVCLPVKLPSVFCQFALKPCRPIALRLAPSLPQRPFFFGAA
jgi:hypothetical protein